MAMHRFEFKTDEDFEDARLSLHLAKLAIEGQYGEARTRLEVATRVDRTARMIGVDDHGVVAESLLRSFTKLLIEEFGTDGFEVESLSGTANACEAQPAGAFDEHV